MHVHLEDVGFGEGLLVHRQVGVLGLLPHQTQVTLLVAVDLLLVVDGVDQRVVSVLQVREFELKCPIVDIVGHELVVLQAVVLDAGQDELSDLRARFELV